MDALAVVVRNDFLNLWNRRKPYRECLVERETTGKPLSYNLSGFFFSSVRRESAGEKRSCWRAVTSAAKRAGPRAASNTTPRNVQLVQQWARASRCQIQQERCSNRRIYRHVPSGSGFIQWRSIRMTGPRALLRFGCRASECYGNLTGYLNRAVSFSTKSIPVRWGGLCPFAYPFSFSSCILP